MSAFSSFISQYKPRRKAKSQNPAVKSPFPNPFPKNLSSPTSPHHPYASPEIVDIRDTTSFQSSSSSIPVSSPIPVHSPIPGPSQSRQLEITSVEPLPQTPDVEQFGSPEESQSPEEEEPLPTPRLPTPPRMSLELDLSSGLMSDWIPSHFLDSEAYDRSGSDAHSTMGGMMPNGLRNVGGASTANTEHEVAAVDVRSVVEGESMQELEDSDYESSISDDFVAQIQTLDASDFLKVDDVRHVHARPTRALPDLPPVPRKTAPTPIKIPNPILHGPKVQVIRSSGRRASFTHTPSSQVSPPESLYSGDDVSAVSGTTLARALIGNSYVLSDERASKYRSGGSVLTRADSATLPREEMPYWSSPISGRERNLSGVGDDVPPIPANADSVYMPPKNRRKLPAPQNGNGRKRQSTGSLLSPDAVDGEVFGPALQRSTSSGGLKNPERISLSDAKSPMPLSAASMDLMKTERRISRISEVTSLATDQSPSIGSSRGHLTPTSADPFSASMYTPSPLALEPDRHLPAEEPQSSASEAYESMTPRSPIQSPSSQSEYSPPPPDSHRQSARSTSSEGQLDNVLDYYEHESSPLAESQDVSGHGYLPVTPFRPPFSPISEESSSQLSPPSPFVQRDKAQKSRMSTLSGKFVISSSPSSAGGSVDWPSARKEAPTRLLPIGETPQTTLPTTPSPSTPSTGTSSKLPISATTPSSTSILTPPLPSLIFNRQRSGSTPNPIRIDRDPRDRAKYDIMIGRPASSSGSPPTSASSEVDTNQTFPETPGVFTPTQWSPGSLISPGMPRFALGDRDSAAEQMFPQTPMSAFGMGLASPSTQTGGDGMPSLAQQLLTRAASSVQGVRTTRPGADITRARTVAQPNPATMGVEQDAEQDRVDAGPEDEEEGKKKRQPQPSWITQHFSDLGSETGSPVSSRYSYYQPEALPAVPPLPAELRQTSSATPVSLPQLPPSPPTDSPASTPEPLSMPSGLVGYTTQPSHNAVNVADPPLPRQLVTTTQTPTPDITPSPSTQSLNAITESPVAARPPPQRQYSQPDPQHQPQPMLSKAQYLESEHRHDSFDDAPALPSPPPYYTLVFESGPESLTPNSGQPSTSRSGHSRTDSEYRSSTSSPNAARNDHRNSRRMRNRPGVPLGPRRPTDQLNNRAGTSSGHQRERNASVSSLVSVNPSNTGSGPRRVSAGPLGSPGNGPRFQTPPVRWRGHTMDAAKWTFTSTQLQAIVSRAIKHSAEASFIRLLRLETVDEEIPKEMRRLEMHRTDIKSRYKMLARRRTEALARLTSSIEGTIQEDGQVALNLVSRVSELSIQLDQLAEELHSVDEQLSQLRSLTEVHQASALAMALRKLNTSFLKQVSISEGLRQQVESLEAERDDAWKQAERVAIDFDNLSEKMSDTPAESSSVNRSNRSSRVLALRKSSIRVSKAGLRSSSRRSSTSSHRLSTATLSGAKSAYSVEDIPPVPPIPRPRRTPVNIITDLRTSTTGMSTDATPNSATRAMVQAHEELCDLLGIKMDVRPRRSRSVMEPPQDRLSVGGSGPPDPSRPTSSRPLSMPDSSGLSEVYNVMTADRKAMLATLEMLSDPA